jgi:hypothetical protein
LVFTDAISGRPLIPRNNELELEVPMGLFRLVAVQPEK